MSKRVTTTNVKPEEVSVKEFWAALNLSLSQITSFPFIKNEPAPIRNSAAIMDRQDPALTKVKPTIKGDVQRARDVATGESIKIIKLSSSSKSSSGSSSSNNGGVNHLNLIQIKGNPIHAWQPKLTVDHMNMNSVSRPNLNCAQINKLLMKNENVTPTCYV